MKKTIATNSTLLALLLLTGCTFGPNGIYVCEDDDNIFIHFENGHTTTNA
ncbi:hypothetical protein VDG1235_18 [Verrucomicrobiia bacterium DG1235]|nr:hypothetical protein VDG1235_18 [Verrucomicrobiae bacterium DG1235]